MIDPVAFSKHNLSNISHAEYFLSEYKDWFKFEKREDVLEIGCASGVITRKVLYPFVGKHLNSLIAIDLCQNAVNVATELYAAPNLYFQQMNIEDENVWMEYEEKFGHIFAFDVLTILKSPERWSQNIFKMLKKNGRFLASVILPYSTDPPFPYVQVATAQRADNKLFGTAPWYKYLEKAVELFADYGSDPSASLKNILLNAGFKVDVAEIHPLQLKFEDLNGTFRSADAFMKYIPEELCDAYVTDYLKKLGNCVQQADDGGYAIPVNVLAIMASKI